MAHVGVRLLLKDMSFMNIAMKEEDALKMFNLFISKSYKEEEILGGPALGMGYGAWAVRVSSIHAMHTFDLESVQQPSPATIPQPSKYPWGTNGSGL